MIRKQKILYDDKFLNGNTLFMNEGVIILNHKSEILFINKTASNLISENFQTEFIIGGKITFPIEEHYKFLGLKKTLEIQNDRYIDIEYSKIFWNQEICNLVIITEITHLKNLEKITKENAWVHSRTLEFLKEGVLFFNLRGIVIYANPYATSLLGAKNEELLGMKFESLFENKENHLILESLSEMMSYSISRELMNKLNGDSFYAEYLVSPVLVSGEVQGAVISIRDISNKIQREEIESKYKDQLLYLTHTSNKFLEIQNSKELFTFICSEFNSFFINSVVIFNTFDPTINLFTTRAHSGLKSKMNEIYDVLGRDIIGLSFTDENFLVPGENIRRILSIFEIKYGNFNRNLCNRLEVALDAKYIYIVPFTYKGLYLGNCLILSKSELEFTSGFEVFQDQCSNNLYRDFSLKDRQKNLFRTDPFIENLSLEYIEISREGNILYTNKAFETKTGFSNQEILGRNFWTTFLPELGLEEIHKIQLDLTRYKKALSSSPMYLKNQIPEPATWEWIYRESDGNMDLLSGIRRK